MADFGSRILPCLHSFKETSLDSTAIQESPTQPSLLFSFILLDYVMSYSSPGLTQLPPYFFLT